MVRRFNQHVARVGERQQAAGTQARDEIGDHVDVGAGCKAQGNAFLVENALQALGGFAQRRAGVVVQSREDVRGAGYDRYALGDGGFRHVERNRKVARPIVDTRQDMAMKINHS